MKIKILSVLLAVFLLSGGILAQMPDVGAVGDAAFATAKKAFNDKVKDIPFAVGSAELKLNDPSYRVAGISIDQFMKTVLIPALSKLINVLPTDKKVVISGHANTLGSENGSSAFIGNIALSKKRAEAVLEYILANSDLDRSKFTIQAKGSSSPKGGANGEDPVNCRVSLDIQ